MSQKYWSSKDRLEEAPGSQTEFSVHYKLHSHKILSTISLKRHFEEIRIILLLKTLIQFLQLGNSMSLHIVIKLMPQGTVGYAENNNLLLKKAIFPGKSSSPEGIKR